MKMGYEPSAGGVYLPELDPNNQERVYMRVRHDGSSCIMETHEAEELLRDAPGVYLTEEVRMSPAQYEKLPEFAGW